MRSDTILLTATAVALLGIFYYVQLGPVLKAVGFGRVVEQRGNIGCRAEAELQACEKIVIHQPTGLLYLACSTPSSRTQWTPALSHLNASGMSRDDHVALYDPETSKVTRLQLRGYDSSRDLSVHGMDVVPSSSNPNDLFVYLVNHRRPRHGVDPKVHGANSSIEIFKTSIGSSILTHIESFDDPVIQTPNDVVGSPTGRSFWFTNDHGSKIGLLRELEFYLGWPRSSVGFCEIQRGCKYAATGLPASNGIARAANDTFYVGSSGKPQIHVLERRADDTLLVKDVIHTDRLIDNVAVDQSGALWAAGKKAMRLPLRTLETFADPSLRAPSSALRVTRGDSGRKYRLEKVFEDDGALATGSTSVAHDSQRGRLFLHGLVAPYLTICDSPA
ncbi:calcium-dependent phosphotriesterase [Gloeophyllum trabeum ATCC 11539]|uniref:Calcium-dependent phosphotriesterase n=1 Tax=Gloeophyllum trabeum (strain ATCC 11539 / FP-39264 / Madison 617) TaxID=670483 RepID=S7QDT4_GLOTA|nr:calcium-dependent phosphotriesterase [Gloeophyllum trabeum ATCC 11539]EPQ57522.1 calcium-dependent phosphotriesterase [Gloeophyllum trabeum ATCC 11539]